jgi:GTP pyrophosphokinase
MDFLDAIKLNLFASEIFVFTPKGDIITMPANCTALDFAFQIHTFLGTHCIGAKVNHRLVPLSQQLKGGDQVEIITSPSQHVHRDWLNYVTTAKARNKIQSLLRKQEREQARAGEEILKAWLEQNGLTITTQSLDRLRESHMSGTNERLLIDIANGDITLDQRDLNCVLYGPKNADNKLHKRGWRRYVPFMKAKEPKKITERDIIYTISLRGIDRKGMLKDVSTLLYEQFDINILKLNIQTNDGIFSCEAVFKVRDNTILDTIIQKMKEIEGIKKVQKK